ncbi:MAG: molybdate ABC transporter permease subunit [Finegoldia sp.]|nr:molybdate ABC transporter permease subunit [Finegoldia sp.]
MDSNIISAVLISLKVATISTLITGVLGIIFARFRAYKSKRVSSFMDTAISILMVLPPSLVGYILLRLIGNNGPIGRILLRLGSEGIVFSWVACVIASSVVSFPIMYQNAKGAFLSIDERVINAARTMGASEFKIFRRITLPLAQTELISGIILAFARGLGEFGATMMVAGNIVGKTQTISLALYYAVERGDTRTANILMLVVIGISFALIYTLNKWIEKKKERC